MRNGHSIPATPLSSRVLRLDEDGPWPLAAVLAEHKPRIVDDLERKFQAGFPTGAWQQAANRAVVLPIMPSGETGRAGVSSPASARFACSTTIMPASSNLIAGQIAAAIANAEAYEQERRRAEALSEIDRAKTAFFSNISHEFRTPLTLMLGPLEDALRHADELPPERLEEVTVAHRNAMRLLRLVNALLDFSRVEAGRAEVNFETTDLAVFTRDLASNFRSVCERAGIALRIDCEPQQPPAYINRDMWEKVVLNLLSNAFKFTFTGGIDVRLETPPAAPGSPCATPASAFPPPIFPACSSASTASRASAGARTRDRGSGLLWCASSSTSTAATSSVDSEVGRGTTFTVTIPYGEAPGRQAEMAQAETARDLTTATRATAFVAEALRWLPRPRTPMPPSCAKPRTRTPLGVAPTARQRASSSPTTIPICAIMCGAS